MKKIPVVFAFLLVIFGAAYANEFSCGDGIYFASIGHDNDTIVLGIETKEGGLTINPCDETATGLAGAVCKFVKKSSETAPETKTFPRLNKENILFSKMEDDGEIAKYSGVIDEQQIQIETIRGGNDGETVYYSLLFDNGTKASCIHVK